MANKQLGHAVALEDILSGEEQPLSAQERALVEKGYALLALFRRQTQEHRARAALCRKIFLLEDPEQDAPGTPPAQRAPQLHTLKSTVVACVADQMDNLPEAALLPERPELAEVAADLADVVRYVLERNGFERLHRQRTQDFFQTGTAITQVAWDADLRDGQGDVALIRWPVESFFWDPAADTLDEARAVFKTSLHPLSWYAEHFPEAARYVRGDRFAQEDAQANPWDAGAQDAQDEDEALLVEYWYRRYDAQKRRYSVHCAYMAGGALLYASQREQPEGVYWHGRYPFVLDVYTAIEGKPVGNGMVWDFAAMQRAVNRYAQYIDENTRMSAKTRLLVNRAAGIEEEALTDWNRNIIEGDNIGENALRWFQSQPLSGQVNAQMASFQDQIKRDSGQNQFSRGEAGLGVTAASAIVALQEAGGKTARLHTATLSDGFRQMVELMLWLLMQHYDRPRTQQITGRDASVREVTMSAERMLGGDPDDGAMQDDPMMAMGAMGDPMMAMGGMQGDPMAAMGAIGDPMMAMGAMQGDPMMTMGGMQGDPMAAMGDALAALAAPKPRRRRKLSRDCAPPYLVQVQVQRRNPMRQQAQNDFIMQMSQIAAQAGQAIPPAKLVELLQMDGKDRLLPVLRELDDTRAQMAALAQQAEQAQAAAGEAGKQVQQMQLDEAAASAAFARMDTRLRGEPGGEATHEIA